MKALLILIGVSLAMVAGIFRMPSHHPSASAVADSGGRKALYYTCAMHPWVRESKPGPCPVCGMNLTPVYENHKNAMAADTNMVTGEVTLESENINTINVQTDIVTNQPVRRTIHVSGQIIGNSSQAAWFEFTAYQRDLKWLQLGQVFQVVVEGVPDKTFTAEIKSHGVKPFADTEFDMMSGSTKMRAEISSPPVEISNFERRKLFDNLHAEAHLVAETESVLAIPRSAIISRGPGAMVYVDKGNGRYAPREISLGRIGDNFAEVTGGLQTGEKVVTTGNVLIDSEAQLTSEQ
jgi:multidrug efflux pump subunit AcrA (membrane-fusion protein)